MDSSKYHVSTEGCSSSESGWTTYIDSPMQEDDDEYRNDDDDDDDNNYHNSNNDSNDNEDNKEDSDDSMASDASSGPSHQHKRANAEGSHSKASSIGKCDQLKKIFSWKKSKEKEKKSGESSSKYKHRIDSHKK